jgi:methylmalonyl-CoA mutase N-terminal domain/subunit
MQVALTAFEGGTVLCRLTIDPAQLPAIGTFVGVLEQQGFYRVHRSAQHDIVESFEYYPVDDYVAVDKTDSTRTMLDLVEYLATQPNSYNKVSLTTANFPYTNAPAPLERITGSPST